MKSSLSKAAVVAALPVWMLSLVMFRIQNAATAAEQDRTEVPYATLTEKELKDITAQIRSADAGKLAS